MVLLTVTPAIAKAIEICEAISKGELSELLSSGDGSRRSFKAGDPVAHSQILDIWKLIRKHKGRVGSSQDFTDGAQCVYLDYLLRGSRIFIPRPEPKPEPSPEYKALMKRLRQEEELKLYERMLNPSPSSALFTHGLNIRTSSSPAQAASEHVKQEEEEMTFSDVNRQLAMIFNVLISIIACSVAIWIAARHWSTPKRLGLSMAGSGIVAVAEVAIYLGYLSRLSEAKTREKKKVEVKEIFETWVIGPSNSEEQSGAIFRQGMEKTTPVRQRRKEKISKT